MGPKAFGAGERGWEAEDLARWELLLGGAEQLGSSGSWVGKLRSWEAGGGILEVGEGLGSWRVRELGS